MPTYGQKSRFYSQRLRPRPVFVLSSLTYNAPEDACDSARMADINLRRE